MQTFSVSNFETKLSSLGELLYYWLQRSTFSSSMSENILCVTVHNNIFDAKCVIAQEQFLLTGAQHHWIIWRHGKSNNFKKCLPLKFCDAKVVAFANFVDRFPTV